MTIWGGCRSLPCPLPAAVQIVGQIQLHLDSPFWPACQFECEIERGHSEHFVVAQMGQTPRGGVADSESHWDESCQFSMSK